MCALKLKLKAEVLVIKPLQLAIGKPSFEKFLQNPKTPNPAKPEIVPH